MLRSGDDYFSEESMRRREPLLYERMVGRNLTEEERRATSSSGGGGGGLGTSDCSLTNIILEHIDINRERDLKKVNRESHEESLGQW